MAESTIRYEHPPVLQSICAFGSETLVPNNEICRLSYYLKCCVVGCGINIGIDEDLLDYMNAHKMTGEQQKQILEYSFNALSLANLINRAFILDDQHVLLPHGTLNTFFEFKTASTYFSINTFFSVATGHQFYVHKVMLCTLKWMREYYIDPFVRYQQGNPVIEIQAIPVAEDDELSYAVVGDGSNNTNHGVVVTPVDPPSPKLLPPVCRSCYQTIRSTERPFYRCAQCPNAEFCDTCYAEGCHDQTHVFERICRTSTEALTARVEVLCERDASFVPDVPMAIAIPVEQLGMKKRASVAKSPRCSDPMTKTTKKSNPISSADLDRKPAAKKRRRGAARQLFSTL